MQFEISLLSNPVYIDLPSGLIGWLGWLGLLSLIVLLASLNLTRAPLVRPGTKGTYWMLVFSLLFLLVPLTSLLFAIRLPAGNSLPPPGRPVDPTGPVLVLFTFLPCLLAAGILGHFPAFFIGLTSGLVIALWDSHNPFTPLEFGLLAYLFSAAIRQRYSSREFQLLRVPVLASLLLAVLYPILFFYSSVFYAGGDLANRLDYAFTHIGWVSLATASRSFYPG
jgi:hypothetical protein